MADLIPEYVSKIDFLSLDTEGSELQILQSIRTVFKLPAGSFIDQELIEASDCPRDLENLAKIWWNNNLYYNIISIDVSVSVNFC